jgi:hypothetical protein
MRYLIQRLLFISILSLSACSSPPLFYELSQETDVYREFKMVKQTEAFHNFTTAKQQIWGYEHLKAEEGDKISLTTHGCDVSESDGSGWHTNYIIDCGDDQYLLKSVELTDEGNSFPENFELFKGDEKIFVSQMFQGASPNPIVKAQSLHGQLILSFTVLDSLEAERYSTSWSFFWEGGVPSEFQGFEQMRAVFEYDDRLGFLATDLSDDMTYLYYDGKKVSPPYNSVRLTTCCAADPHVYSLYSNGVFMLMGQRNDEYYLTEVVLR